MIRMITEYCNCADDLPMLATDILSKLIDLLKVNTNSFCLLSVDYVLCVYVCECVYGYMCVNRVCSMYFGIVRGLG